MIDLDAIGGAAVGISATLIVAVLASRSAHHGRALAMLLGGWALALGALASIGLFSYPGGIGTPAIGAALLGLMAAGVAVWVTAPGRAVLAVPLPILTRSEERRVGKE